MSSRERYSDNPAFLLLQALITGQRIFYATGDGNVNKKTIVCSDLTAVSDQDGNQVHIVDPNSAANGQVRDIAGATAGGTINLGIAFDVQITEDTAFIITGIRSTPVELAAFELWVKTALGSEWDGTPDLYDVLVTGGIPVWPAAADIGNDVSIAQAIRAILTSMVGGDDYDNYTAVNNTANASLNVVFQNFATLFAADGANIFNPTIQGAARTDLELALAALATYISAGGAALNIKVNDNAARTNLEQVWEDYLAVIGCDNANVFNPSIGGSARTTVEAALAALGTIIGDPSGETLTSITAKFGNIARSLDLILGARWDAAGDLGADIVAIIAKTDLLNSASGSGTLNDANGSDTIVPSSLPAKTHLIFDISNLNNNADNFTIEIKVGTAAAERVVAYYNLTSDGTDITADTGTGLGSVIKQRRIDISDILCFTSEQIIVELTKNGAADRDVAYKYLCGA